MDKKIALDKINVEMATLNTCALKKTATQAVPGDGNADATLVFIGEAPGKSEDEQGKPFVGASGKFLAEMLASINMKRGDIYITNIVKYRPPNNRDPLPDEVSACLPWLVKQIELINPKLIITLGRHALERFLPGKKISVVHGQAFRTHTPEFGMRVFYALYHPAAALYNGALRETLIKDFQKIPEVLAKIK